MGNRSELSTQQRMQRVLGLLSKEEPGTDRARADRSRRYIVGGRSSSRPVKRPGTARVAKNVRAKALGRLSGEVAERDR